MAMMIARVHALALATTVMVHADNCATKWAWKEKKYDGAAANTEFHCGSIKASDANKCITTGLATDLRCDCGEAVQVWNGDDKCCKDKVNTCQTMGSEFTGTAFHATAIGDCRVTAFKVPDYTKRAMACDTTCRDTAATFESTCCKDMTCDTHTDNLGVASTCPAEKKKIAASATTACISGCTFETTCCEPATCADKKTCDEFSSGQCTVPTTTISKTACGNLKMFDSNKATNPLDATNANAGNNWDGQCCTTQTCSNANMRNSFGAAASTSTAGTCNPFRKYDSANKADADDFITTDFDTDCCIAQKCSDANTAGSLCNSGKTYDAANKANLDITNTGTFDSDCCIVAEKCSSLLTTTAYTCEGTSAITYPKPTTAVATETAYRTSCCSAKVTCSTIACNTLVDTDPDGLHGNAGGCTTAGCLKAKSQTNQPTTCEGFGTAGNPEGRCRWDECCEYDTTQCEGKARSTTNDDNECTAANNFEDPSKFSLTFTGTGTSTFQATCCTLKAHCGDWNGATLITSITTTAAPTIAPEGAAGKAASQQAVSVWAATVAVLLMGKNL